MWPPHTHCNTGDNDMNPFRLDCATPLIWSLGQKNLIQTNFFKMDGGSYQTALVVLTETQSAIESAR